MWKGLSFSPLRKIRYKNRYSKICRVEGINKLITHCMLIFFPHIKPHIFRLVAFQALYFFLEHKIKRDQMGSESLKYWLSCLMVLFTLNSFLQNTWRKVLKFVRHVANGAIIAQEISSFSKSYRLCCESIKKFGVFLKHCCWRGLRPDDKRKIVSATQSEVQSKWMSEWLDTCGFYVADMKPKMEKRSLELGTDHVLKEGRFKFVWRARSFSICVYRAQARYQIPNEMPITYGWDWKNCRSLV